MSEGMLSSWEGQKSGTGSSWPCRWKYGTLGWQLWGLCPLLPQSLPTFTEIASSSHFWHGLPLSSCNIPLVIQSEAGVPWQVSTGQRHCLPGLCQSYWHPNYCRQTKITSQRWIFYTSAAIGYYLLIIFMFPQLHIVFDTIMTENRQIICVLFCTRDFNFLVDWWPVLHQSITYRLLFKYFHQETVYFSS